MPDLLYEKSGAKQSDGSKIRVIGLLGREFLYHATQVYRGSEGIVEVTMDEDSFKPKTPKAS